MGDFYSILFNLIRDAPESVAHGREGYYFLENGNYSFYQLARSIAEALVQVGKGTNSEPSTFTDEEIQEYFDVSKFLLLPKCGRSHVSHRDLGFGEAILVVLQTARVLLAGSLPKLSMTSWWLYCPMSGDYLSKDPKIFISRSPENWTFY